MTITYHPIGIIHTPFREKTGTPIQPVAGRDVEGTIQLFPEFADGLLDLEGFSHIILLFHLHRAGPPRLRTIPFLDTTERGIFAIRGPSRPNPIGLSVVRLVRIEGDIIHIRDLDMLDGTPLLDIKPYIPRTDSHPDARIGWLTGKESRFHDTLGDGRFG